MHLGEPDLAGDLGLGESAEEPQQQDLSFALGQRREQRCEALAVLDQVELRFGLAECGGEPGPVPRAAAPVMAAPRFVQRRGVARTLRRQPLQDDLKVQVEMSGDLAGPGGPAVALGEVRGGVEDP